MTMKKDMPASLQGCQLLDLTSQLNPYWGEYFLLGGDMACIELVQLLIAADYIEMEQPNGNIDDDVNLTFRITGDQIQRICQVLDQIVTDGKKLQESGWAVWSMQVLGALRRVQPLFGARRAVLSETDMRRLQVAGCLLLPGLPGNKPVLLELAEE